MTFRRVVRRKVENTCFVVLFSLRKSTGMYGSIGFSTVFYDDFHLTSILTFRSHNFSYPLKIDFHNILRGFWVLEIDFHRLFRGFWDPGGRFQSYCMRVLAPGGRFPSYFTRVLGPGGRFPPYVTRILGLGGRFPPYFMRVLAPGDRFPSYFTRFLGPGRHQEPLQKASAADMEENVPNRAFLQSK